MLKTFTPITYRCCAILAHETLGAIAVVVRLFAAVLYALPAIGANIQGIAGIGKVTKGATVGLLANALEATGQIYAAPKTTTILDFLDAFIYIVFTMHAIEARGLAVAFIVTHKIMTLAAIHAGIGGAFIDLFLTKATRIAQAAFTIGYL